MSRLDARRRADLRFSRGLPKVSGSDSPLAERIIHHSMFSFDKQLSDPSAPGAIQDGLALAILDGSS
jgi:hypothetical protein